MLVSPERKWVPPVPQAIIGLSPMGRGDALSRGSTVKQPDCYLAHLLGLEKQHRRLDEPRGAERSGVNGFEAILTLPGSAASSKHIGSPHFRCGRSVTSLLKLDAHELAAYPLFDTPVAPTSSEDEFQCGSVRLQT